jgi:CheY-like chemotaxis protein
VTAADPLEPVPESARKLAGLRVLIVEDRDENRHYLSHVLRGAGVQVDTASDGEAGLIHFKNGHYDLVLTDLDMPGMDGFRLLEEIRREEELEGREGIPVAAVTAHADDATAERCFRAGMDAFVLKPVARNQLLQVVADLARSDPLIFVVEDDPRSQELACQILVQRGYRAEGTGTGEAALSRISKGGVAAVLLDMSLPDIPGLDVVRRIRDLPNCAELPVIGVTGHVGADQADLCRDAGCTAFLEKPVRWERLLEQLESLLPRDKKPVFSSLVEGMPRPEGSGREREKSDPAAGGGPQGAAAAGD